MPHQPAITAPILATPRPAWALLGAGFGVAILGTLAAMLLVHLPAAVADRFAHPDSTDAVHRLPLLALVPVLVAVGVVAGRRLARRVPLTGVVPAVVLIVVGLCCARLLVPIFGGLVPGLPAIAGWAAGLAAVAAVAVRLAHRPRGPLPWIALTLGTLALADLAVAAAVWLDPAANAVPVAYALSWFPGALLDPAVRLPMGTDAAGGPVNWIILDTVEFLPHALIVTSAFTLAYVHTAARRGRSR